MRLETEKYLVLRAFFVCGGNFKRNHNFFNDTLSSKRKFELNKTLVLYLFSKKVNTT